MSDYISKPKDLSISRINILIDWVITTMSEEMTYIRMTEDERETVRIAVEKRFNNENRISVGAACRLFAEEAMQDA